MNQALTNPSQLVIRNSQWLECRHLMMIGMPADNLAAELLSEKVTDAIEGLSGDYSDFREIRKTWDSQPNLSLNYAAVLESTEQKFDGILLFLQKSKPLMDFWLQMALTFLEEGGSIWLVGENGEGIKSWKKRLKQSFSAVKVIESARHCVLLEASEPLNKPNAVDLEQSFQQFDVPCGDEQLHLFSLPGVFSHGRLDVGTRTLLDSLVDIPQGKVLDFGCGAGVISAYIDRLPGKRSFTLVDCDALALASSRKSLKMAGVEDFEVVASDGLFEINDRYDLIISNPPFHQGVKTHYAVTEQFLSESFQHLKVGGELRIVANSFLRYSPIIKKTFGNCETILSRNGFSIYKAVKRKK